MTLDISYKKYKSSSDIHGTILYPAPMIAPMQTDVLKLLINKDKQTTIMDPFNGSGVVLYEALSNFDNIVAFGMDINPYAIMISKVKLQGVEDSIEVDINRLEQLLNISEEVVVEHSFENINKWFRKDIILSFSKIRSSIMKIENTKNRMFFWVIFSNIIRKYSNTRTSTYKLHIKEEIKISGIKDDSISYFLMKIRKSVKFYNRKFANFNLKKCDSIKEMTTMKSSSIDIIITSPPYGDNHTTVPYGQFSSLPLLWIDKNDLELDGWELENYSIIDSMSMGGKVKKVDKERLHFIDNYTRGISQFKLKKVHSFLDDYIDFLDNIARISSEYIVLTLGNRTVDGVQINLTDFSISYLIKKAFVLDTLSDRIIPQKRIPKTTSKVNEKPVSSMNKEYLVILKKQKA